MTAQPQWAPIDDERSDLLSLVAEGTMATDTAEREWRFFLSVLEDVAQANAGIVNPNLVRPLIAKVVAPQRAGAFYNRASRRDIIQATGQHVLSDDTSSGNAGKPIRTYRWLGVA